MQERTSDWRALWHGVNRAIGRKWSVHVLRLLDEQATGFNELQRALDGPTAKTLSERLSELQCAGLVSRHVEATSPPSTRYELTEAGERFVAVLRSLERVVEVVDCGCADGCELITVDSAQTAAHLPECC